MKSSLEYQFLLQDPEEEYMKFKKKLYRKVFYIILGFFLASWLAELYQTLSNFRYQPFIEFSIGVLLVSVYILSSKKCQEGIITIFFVYAYLSSVYRNYTTRSDIIFSNPFDSFYFSYGLAALEAIIATRIPSLKWKLFFVLASSFGRMLIIPFNRKGLFGVQMFFLGLKIYFDVDREKHERNLYRLYFDYKQQLGKFKDLIVNDVSQAIAIISPNLSSCIFTNTSFHEFLAHCNGNIETLFQQFIVQNDTDSRKSSSTRSLKGNNSQNLLGLLKTNFFDQASSPQKMSCILQYTTPSNSTKRVFSAVLMSIMWDDEPCTAVMLRDITEQNTILSLRIADLHKDMMIATVSHELRTPLNSMLGMLKILQRRVEDVELQGFLSICQNSGSLLLSLVNSILDMNQIKAKKLKLNMERVEIWEVLKGVLALFEFQFKMKKVEFVVESMELMKSWIVTDKNRLNQILINLVGNALKFTSKGSVRVTASKENNGKYLRFEVKDTGTGIKEEDMGKLFRMFGRLDNDENHQGVGLGLTISDSLARVLCDDEDLKGIKVESKYKEGSMFSFVIATGCCEKEGSKERIETIGDEFGVQDDDKKTLDLYQMKPKMKGSIQVELTSRSLPVGKGFSSLPTTPRKDWMTRERTPISSTSSKFKQPTRRIHWILLVDDNLFNIAVGKQFIESLGYGVKSAYSGEEAISFIENNNNNLLEKIDLILMDCQMPGIGGYEATRILREKMDKKEIDEIPIVALTANDSEMNKQACLEAGMSDYLSKPLKEDELLNITKKYIIRRK